MLTPKQNKALFNAIYKVRLLVFMETGPQTNKYQQVALNEAQFKKISNAIAISSVKNADGDFDSVVNMEETIYTLPDIQELPIETDEEA